MEQEKWRVILSNTDYEVSTLGRIRSNKTYRSNKPRILKPYLTKYGYMSVTLYELGYEGTPKPQMVHRLVAEAFLNNSGENEFINHINGDRSDNRLENLEWVNHRENVTHSYKSNIGSEKLTGAFQKRRYGVLTNRWGAAIRINNKLKHLGYRGSEEEAHQLYLDALKEYELRNRYVGVF